jgi:LysR family transcriptional regulator, hydrogen peroxide-inducible genes activator
MNLPTVKQLRYFVALEERQHFGRAAEACFVSQSAFSVAIRELESGLGVRLVDRTNRKVTVSQLGREVAAQARLCIRDLEALVEIAGGSRGALAGPLRLGVIPTIAPFLLPKVLPGLRNAYPELQLLLREEITQRVYDQLMDGELDLTLIALPYEMRNVEVMKLFKDRFRLACRAGTKLVDPGNYRFDRLDADSVLLLEDGHCLRDHAISACRIRKLDKVSRFSASSLLTLVEMVDADLGITYLPEMAEGSSILAGTRVETHSMREDAYREIGLAWRAGSGRAREFRLLGEFIREHASPDCS